jgi:cold shock CspA family protein
MKKMTGTINVFFAERGYGFVYGEDPNGTTTKYFLHAANIKSGVPVSGATVSFDVTFSTRGALAVNAEIGGGK